MTTKKNFKSGNFRHIKIVQSIGEQKSYLKELWINFWLAGHEIKKKKHSHTSSSERNITNLLKSCAVDVTIYCLNFQIQIANSVGILNEQIDEKKIQKKTSSVRVKEADDFCIVRFI